MFKNERNKLNDDIIKEWNDLAPVRHRQTSSGVDVTFAQIIVPTMLSLLPNLPKKRLLDVGAGTGVFSALVASRGFEVTAIDPSPVAISIAIENFGSTVEFLCTDCESFSQTGNSKFDVVCANMVAMNVGDLETFFRAIRQLTNENGCAVLSVTHPCFWPRFCEYENEEWFRYANETMISGPFMISAEPSIINQSTHFHRPLSDYVNAISRSGLSIESMHEPLPSDEIKYLWPYVWKFPRYLFFKLIVN